MTDFTHKSAKSFGLRQKLGDSANRKPAQIGGRLAELLLKSATVEFGRLPVRELPHCWTPEQVRQIPAAMRIASNQMLLNFGRTRSPGRSGHEIRSRWSASSAKPAATHWRT